MPAIYEVETSEGKRLVKANNQAQARNHVLKIIKVRSLSGAEVADAMGSVKLEDATAEPSPERPSMESALKQADAALKKA